MHLRHHHFLLLALLLAACGGSSSPVTVEGHALRPKDSVFWTGVWESANTTRVIVTDQEQVCTRYPDADACDEAARLGVVGRGTFLWLSVSGSSTGDYEVEGKDRTRLAELTFSVRGDDGVEFTTRAVSGTVSFTDLYPNSSAAGRYHVKLANGEVVDGSFNARACDPLSVLMQRATAAQLTCSTTFSSTLCSARCTCATRSTAADCARTDAASEWSCTCRRSGEPAKCTVPKTEANVCAQGNGCCDLAF